MLLNLRSNFKPTSLHLDYSQEKLYFLDSEKDEIYRYDLDGHDFEQITKHNDSVYGHLRGIALYNVSTDRILFL